MRLWQALKQDIKFQFRHGFYYAYLVISIIYIIILLNIPWEYRPFIAGLIVFSDPAMLGFFFVGAIVLLERDENILESLFVTPLKISEYFTARVISLGVLAVLTAFLITILTIDSGINYIMLFVGLILTAVLFTLFGFTLVVRVNSVNQYLITSILYSIIIIIPVLSYLNIFDTFLFYLWPTRASLLLIIGSYTGNIKQVEGIYAVITLLIWIKIGYTWAHRWFYKYIVLKIGDKK